MPPSTGLRPHWRAEHRSKNLLDLRNQRFQRELFANCKLENVRGAIFEHCAMADSSLEPKSLADLLGVTMTLDCLMFESWKWNEMAMDAMLFLLSITQGNDERRTLLRRMVRPESLVEFEKLFSRLECYTR